eukprot:PhM_4_TR13719/c0_g1_i1/m.29272
MAPRAHRRHGHLVWVPAQRGCVRGQHDRHPRLHRHVPPWGGGAAALHRREVVHDPARVPHSVRRTPRGRPRPEQGAAEVLSPLRRCDDADAVRGLPSPQLRREHRRYVPLCHVRGLDTFWRFLRLLQRRHALPWGRHGVPCQGQLILCDLCTALLLHGGVHPGTGGRGAGKRHMWCHTQSVHSHLWRHTRCDDARPHLLHRRRARAVLGSGLGRLRAEGGAHHTPERQGAQPHHLPRGRSGHHHAACARRLGGGDDVHFVSRGDGVVGRVRQVPRRGPRYSGPEPSVLSHRGARHSERRGDGEVVLRRGALRVGVHDDVSGVGAACYRSGGGSGHPYEQQ